MFQFTNLVQNYIFFLFIIHFCFKFIISSSYLLFEMWSWTKGIHVIFLFDTTQSARIYQIRPIFFKSCWRVSYWCIMRNKRLPGKCVNKTLRIKKYIQNWWFISKALHYSTLTIIFQHVDQLEPQLLIEEKNSHLDQNSVG